jgi:hypothetical protein
MVRPSGDQAMGAETWLSSRMAFAEEKSRIVRLWVDESVAIRGNASADADDDDEDEDDEKGEDLPTRRGGECKVGEKLATGPTILV